MELFMNMGWLGKSFTGMVCLVPVMLMFNFFGKNFDMRPEALMCAWMVGVSIGIMSALKLNVLQLGNTPIIPIVVVVLLGIVVGTPANVLLAQAIPTAPNPALPFTVVNSGSVVAYILAPALAIMLPRYFDPMSFNWPQLLGVTMVIGGLGLFMFRPSA
jgi:hypothetical protein